MIRIALSLLLLSLSLLLLIVDDCYHSRMLLCEGQGLALRADDPDDSSNGTATAAASQQPATDLSCFLFHSR